jgi:hypothetical protein
MPVFHYVVHQYADDHFVPDLTQGVQHVDDQSLGVLHDQCVVPMCVTYLLLALMNENVRKLELQYFHQLVFLRAA